MPNQYLTSQLLTPLYVLVSVSVGGCGGGGGGKKVGMTEITEGERDIYGVEKIELKGGIYPKLCHVWV